jgi:ElaA protein
MIKWICKEFDVLTSHELYAILQLRNEVFVVEQNCIFQDADNRDQKCRHLMGWENETLVAYTRLMPPGVIYTLPSIGRVVTSLKLRNTGTGKILMEKSIEEIYRLFGVSDIKIGAQIYLQKFYESLGFKQTSDLYLEDGIQHIEMIKTR